MSNIFDIKNNLAWTFKDKVIEICKPMFCALGLNYFDYARFYPSGRCFFLYSDAHWVDCFINEFRYRDPPTELPSGIFFWQRYISEDITNIASSEFNHAHGVTIKTEYGDYTEVINFAAPPENISILDVYLNKQHLLFKFQQYFITKAASLIDQSINAAFILPAVHHSQQKILESSDDKTKKLVRLYEENKIRNEVKFFHIARQKGATLREIDCFKGLLEGKSAKEIARDITISYRTVELHIDNLKQKFNCRTRIELLCEVIELLT